MAILLYPPLLMELALALAVCALAALMPVPTARLFALGEDLLDRLPTSLGAHLAVVGLFAVLLRAAFLPWLGPPIPLIPDEYSLILQAQTYLEGRLANPTHPLWPHFQAMHINQVPAYASMYFPGRSLPLLLGLLVGQPWLGVWASFVALAMATVWMLRGWVGPRAALAGGLLVVLRLGVVSYWVDAYWGGAFTALGATLVFGSLPRLVGRPPRWRDGLLLSLGALILMTTRPFEGAVFCAALGACFLPRVIRSHPADLRRLAICAAIPLVASIAMGTMAIAAYNEATTGDPLLTPYDLNREQYAIAPAFLFEAPVEPLRTGAQVPANFERLYREEADGYLATRQSTKALISLELYKLYLIGEFYVGLAMAVPFLIGLWRSRRDLPVVTPMLAVLAAHMLTTWHFPHYAAPILPLALLIVMRGVATLGRWRVAGKPVGYVVSRGAFIAAAAPVIILTMFLATDWPILPENAWDRTCCTMRQTDTRAAIIARLSGTPGRDLVLVEDPGSRHTASDLVYNAPDIDASPIVFAYSLDPASDARLLAYFADRTPWRLTFSAKGYMLTPILQASPTAPVGPYR